MLHEYRAINDKVGVTLFIANIGNLQEAIVCFAPLLLVTDPFKRSIHKICFLSSGVRQSRKEQSLLQTISSQVQAPS